MNRLLRWWREWREAREEYRASREEMQFHIEEETRHNVLNGMSPRAARRAALKAFGGVDRFAEAAHDERAGTRWSDFRMSYLDWKLGARMLSKYPGVSILGGVTLAAAIGIGAGWFELTLMELRPELPLNEGDRLVRIEYWDPVTLDPELRTTHEFVQWRGTLRTVEQLGAHRTVQRNLILPGAAPRVVDVAEISASAFDVTRVPPLFGRPLLPEDEEPGSEPVLVIGYQAWQQYFAGDRTVVGSAVQLGRTRATVVGVMPEGYRFPRSHQFWTPLRVSPAPPLEGAAIQVFGRLAPGATLKTAGAELAAWGARMAASHPATHARLRLNVLPFGMSGELTLQREVFFINLAAWFILALACMNVAALMFARTALRENEIVVRNALGASRARVLGQLFTEALVLTSVAALVGLVGVKVVLSYGMELARQRDNPIPFWWDTDLEPATILYTAVLAVAGAAMVGLLPALRATGQHVRTAMARMGSGGTSMRFGGAWSIIIVLQVTFSVVCLPFGIAAAADAYREATRRAAYPADVYLTFRPALDTEDTDTSATARDERRNAVLAELARRVVAEPDVEDVAVATSLPATYHPLRQLEVDRGAGPPVLVDTNIEGDRVHTGGVGVGFFRTFRTRVVAGREFAEGDVGAATPVVVINESLARNIGGHPLGVRVRFAAHGDEEPGEWREVIGVVRNFGLTPTAQGEADFLYTPVSAAKASHVVVRTRGNAAGFAPRLRTLATRVDPALRLHDVLTLRDVIRRQDLSTVHATLVGVGIVLLAVILSAASLYALMAVAVALRTREIGIRVAIGASARGVLAALFRRAATQVGIGIIVGNLLVALLLTIIVEEVRAEYVVPPMLAASAVMLLVGLAACIVPARRALRIQPTEALREIG